MNDTTRQTGGALGVAVIGSIFAARYHAVIGRLLFVPASVRATAHESIGTSLQVAARLERATGERLVSVAKHAYLSSMRVTYAVGVTVIIVAMIVAYRYLPARAVPAVGDAPAGAGPLGDGGRAGQPSVAVTGGAE